MELLLCILYYNKQGLKNKVCSGVKEVGLAKEVLNYNAVTTKANSIGSSGPRISL